MSLLLQLLRVELCELVLPEKPLDLQLVLRLAEQHLVLHLPHLLQQVQS